MEAQKAMKKFIPFLVLSLFFIASINAMEKTDTNPSTPLPTPVSTPVKKKETRFVLSAKKGGPHKTQKSAITNLEKGDELKIIASHLTDKAFIQALKQTNAATEIILDNTQRNKKAAEEIAKENSNVSIYVADVMPVHAKTIIAKRRVRSMSVDSTVTAPEKNVLVMGSRNLSGHAYHNVEYVEKIKNYEVVNEGIQSFQDLKKTCRLLNSDKSPETKKLNTEKEILASTPQKTTFLDSIKHKLNQITADRLSGSKVRFATMNLTDPVIVQKIKEKAAEGTVFELVINNPSSEKQKEVLDDLADCKNISTYIYNEGNTKKHGKMPNIMHDKFMLRDKDNLVIALTGNATQCNETEYNQVCLNPNYSPESYKNLVAEFDNIKSACSAYKKREKKDTEEKDELSSSPIKASPKKIGVKRKHAEVDQRDPQENNTNKLPNTRRRLF